MKSIAARGYEYTDWDAVDEFARAVLSFANEL
jgi:hypothetical protein